jgi:hypothetical protein
VRLVLVEVNGLDRLAGCRSADEAMCEREADCGHVRAGKTLAFGAEQGPRFKVHELARVRLQQPCVGAARWPRASDEVPCPRNLELERFDLTSLSLQTSLPSTRS